MYLSPAKPLQTSLHPKLYCSSPVQLSCTNQHRGRNCTTVVMNSTVHDHQLGAESRAAMSCELSTINNSVMPLQRVTDTPAKVFARLKAKVQRQNSEEHGGFDFIPRQPCTAAPIFKNMQEPLVDDATLVGHDTYVLTLSPPECISKNTDHTEMTSHLDEAGGYNQDLVHKSVVEKMIIESLPHIKAQQKKTGMNSTSKSTNIRQAQEAYVLLERMPDDLPAQLGPAKPTQLMNCLKNRSYHGVFGENILKNDLEGAVEDSNRVDIVQWSDITDQSQTGSERPDKRSNSLCKHLETPPPPLMEDSLLQLSPRISIPKKQKTSVKSKQQTKEKDKALGGRMNVTEIHLRDWVLKLHNKELIVDGIRIDNKIPWHSSCITERVSDNIVKTASGGTYVLVGKMSLHHGSSFPSWFMKKFLFGFPEMWKEYLNQFLTDTKGSGKNQQRNNSAPTEPQKKWPSKKQTSKQLKSKDSVTPVSSAGSIQPHSAPVSRSGRLIKPPLEYWRGGRITVGPDLNVTVHEDYTSTSSLLTPNTRPVVLFKSLKGQPAYKSEMQNSSDEDTLVPKRCVKQRKSWRTGGTKTWENTSETKSQDAVFNSDSGKKAIAKNPSSQQAQSERMHLRRGRSYSRERNSTGSESEVTKCGAYCGSAKAGVSSGQATKKKNKTLLNRNHLQRVIQGDQHLTTCSDSDTSSTQLQVLKSTGSDHLFTPSDSIKGCRTKALKQKSKTVPHKTTISETNDSDSSIQQGKVNTQKQNNVLQKYDYVVTDAGDESPPSVQSKEDKSKNSKSSLKRTRQKKSSVASEKTTNGPALLVHKHPEQFKMADNPQPPVSNKTGTKPKQSARCKTSKSDEKKPTKHSEQDALQRAWTDKELEKLNEALNSLPMHKSGYWVDVSLLVGTRSAEECQKQYTALYHTRGRTKRKHKAKTSKTDESAKETALITAKVGTLKRKKQMWEFLDHIPKDDHDDLFAGSPMHSKQIKLPIWSTKGDEPDFGHLQNPQTPSSSMFSSVKTPQCLHITPGMLRSVNRDNNDKYVYHLQKVKRQGNHGRKGCPKDKFTPVTSVRKMKRCVAEDDNFVVWNMLSDKDGPSVRAEEEEEEDYFLEEY
ncbi:mis18-binding protein 1 isoform X1 [Silurus meridionalis]|uniref:mis18-binding protein 1 isoform X1 n=1 Tax=Silurus meridionalis TaxID=175797 RepID=UPI001EEB77AD|nr:mis18-binding protein 1 isoform X1 [Silurus meridionalis]